MRNIQWYPRILKEPDPQKEEVWEATKSQLVSTEFRREAELYKPALLRSSVKLTQLVIFCDYNFYTSRYAFMITWQGTGWDAVNSGFQIQAQVQYAL